MHQKTDQSERSKAPYWSFLKNNEMGVAGKLNSALRFVVSQRLKIKFSPLWNRHRGKEFEEVYKEVTDSREILIPDSV